jgi:glutathione S-transferase
MSDTRTRPLVFGAELSPYSVKVRSYLRYKGIDHEWTERNASNMALYQQHAKLPLIPLVLMPDDTSIQDSTPIIERFEAAHPEPSVHPADPTTAFVSALLEEFGDEWGNKWMFHYRWWYEPDQRSAADRISVSMAPAGATAEQRAPIVDNVVGRMSKRLWFVGSSEQTRDAIESSWARALDQLEAHLEDRPYLFGGRPAFGDFGLWGQVYNAWTDPTPGPMVEARPHVLAWVQRMLEPKAEGDFESWPTLAPTLAPLLADHVGALFLPWSDAKAKAIESGAEEFTVELASGSWTQRPQKYHARSLAKLRERYARVADKTSLDPILDAADCRRWLA